MGRPPAARRGPSRLGAFALVALVLAVVAALDQATKALALAALRPGESENVFFGIDLALSRNRGIAFGALASAGDAVIVGLVTVALGLLVAFFAVRATLRLLWLPVGMVLGGAAGNLIDRARTGAVTDFIDPVFWPAFNLADMAIVGGVLGVLYLAEDRRDESEGEQESHERAGAPAPPHASGDPAPWRDSS